ncbi:hypothetical protein [Pontibacter beigongshangensis]|uniref:hypothetical protein n=1 Tax=Pontibacter beigongshangensis TaxID=2574733 RepID=UPI00164EE53D|nr:hypothetical protein [Pontibacter beigongshangensis]
MNDREAAVLVKEIFTKIEQANSIEQINNIVSETAELWKNRMDEISYPKIVYNITRSEIEELKKNNIITEDGKLSEEISSGELDPLTKLLYAIVWKNGDLKKVKHIIQGITSEQDDNKDDGLVFYQFGKYLTKTIGEPIIDQHVIRAFGVFSSMSNDSEIKRLRRLSIITKKEKAYIYAYKEWLNSSVLKEDLKNIKDYSYYIDKVLFAVGKTIKAKL